ncbi:hypothetical protein SLA2020_415560 [Shorea laevis]
MLTCRHAVCAGFSGTQTKMETVELMLESEGASTLPLPRKPNYTCMKSSMDTDFYLDGQEFASINDVTVTVVSGRQIVLYFPLHHHHVSLPSEYTVHTSMIPVFIPSLL